MGITDAGSAAAPDSVSRMPARKLIEVMDDFFRRRGPDESEMDEEAGVAFLDR